MTYFFYSLAGTIWLLNLMIFVIGSVWVLTIAFKELMNEWGIEWKDIGWIAPKKNGKQSVNGASIRQRT